MSKTMRVLIIEDSEDDALLEIRTLEKSGCKAVFVRVETAAAMKSALKDRDWDLILCDYSLPQFNAFEALAILKKTECDIPFIIVSGKIGEETAVEAMKMGAHDYIMKDRLARLVPAVARELKDARSRSKRREAEKDLLQAEQRYRSIFENAHEGIYRSSPQGRFIMANPAMAQMLGYDSPEELMACITDIASQLYVNHEERDKLRQAVEKEGFVRNYEVRFHRRDGRMVWLSVTMHAVRDEKGEVLYYEGIAVNVTERKESADRTRKALGATVQAIAVMVETRDPYTAGHQRRVADLARCMAAEMNLTSEQIDGVRMAGIVHDLGKISVPAEILSKPTKLTDIEFSLIKTHAQSGYDILKDIDFPWPVARMILEHHERMDGSGYPNAATGETLLIESRILTVADVVEAMASHRPYRPSLGLDAALDEMSRNRGILYDPEVVDACLRLFNEKQYQLID